MADIALADPTELGAEVGADWVTPSKLKPLYFDDPSAIWLEHHGAAHGLRPDEPEYSMVAFRAEKGHQFEAAWLERTAPEAVTVCREPWEGREAARVRETLALLAQGAPVIAQPALWWPPERIYGVPDLVALASWVAARFPALAERAALADGPDHYVVLDLKFTSALDAPRKRPSRAFYEAQVRLYSFMLGQIQGRMPRHAWLITRDRLSDPLAVPVGPAPGRPLDSDLAQMRDRYLEIRYRGADLLPWRDPIVAPNYEAESEAWQSARAAIMARVPGGELQRLWQIGRSTRRRLHDLGITSLEALQAADLDSLPQSCLKRPKQMRAILEANRTGRAVVGPGAAPPRRRQELFVDFEFFSNFNVDFEREWPDLHGTPMIFMVGVGWAEQGAWRFRQLVAEAERPDAERALLDQLAALLLELTGGGPRDCALYHWHAAEPKQIQAAADRHGLAPGHMLRGLPWCDLERRVIEHACALPGAWGYSLKGVAQALAAYSPAHTCHWPPGMSDGKQAQLLGWHAYRSPDPLRCREMQLLGAYLEADCRAVWTILNWLRATG
jgi:uncharacterized protein